MSRKPRPHGKDRAPTAPSSPVASAAALPSAMDERRGEAHLGLQNHPDRLTTAQQQAFEAILDASVAAVDHETKDMRRALGNSTALFDHYPQGAQALAGKINAYSADYIDTATKQKMIQAVIGKATDNANVTLIEPTTDDSLPPEAVATTHAATSHNKLRTHYSRAGHNVTDATYKARSPLTDADMLDAFYGTAMTWGMWLESFEKDDGNNLRSNRHSAYFLADALLTDVDDDNSNSNNANNATLIAIKSYKASLAVYAGLFNQVKSYVYYDPHHTEGKKLRMMLDLGGMSDKSVVDKIASKDHASAPALLYFLRAVGGTNPPSEIRAHAQTLSADSPQRAELETIATNLEYLTYAFMLEEWVKENPTRLLTCETNKELVNLFRSQKLELDPDSALEKFLMAHAEEAIASNNSAERVAKAQALITALKEEKDPDARYNKANALIAGVESEIKLLEEVHGNVNALRFMEESVAADSYPEYDADKRRLSSELSELKEKWPIANLNNANRQTAKQAIEQRLEILETHKLAFEKIKYRYEFDQWVAQLSTTQLTQESADNLAMRFCAANGISANDLVEFTKELAHIAQLNHELDKEGFPGTKATADRVADFIEERNITSPQIRLQIATHTAKRNDQSTTRFKKEAMPALIKAFEQQIEGKYNDAEIAYLASEFLTKNKVLDKDCRGIFQAAIKERKLGRAKKELDKKLTHIITAEKTRAVTEAFIKAYGTDLDAPATNDDDDNDAAVAAAAAAVPVATPNADELRKHSIEGDRSIDEGRRTNGLAARKRAAESQVKRTASPALSTLPQYTNRFITLEAAPFVIRDIIRLYRANPVNKYPLDDLESYGLFYEAILRHNSQVLGLAEYPALVAARQNDDDNPLHPTRTAWQALATNSRQQAEFHVHDPKVKLAMYLESLCLAFQQTYPQQPDLPQWPGDNCTAQQSAAYKTEMKAYTEYLQDRAALNAELYHLKPLAKKLLGSDAGFPTTQPTLTQVRFTEKFAKAQNNKHLGLRNQYKPQRQSRLAKVFNSVRNWVVKTWHNLTSPKQKAQLVPHPSLTTDARIRDLTRAAVTEMLAAKSSRELGTIVDTYKTAIESVCDDDSRYSNHRSQARTRLVKACTDHLEQYKVMNRDRLNATNDASISERRIVTSRIGSITDRGHDLQASKAPNKLSLNEEALYVRELQRQVAQAHYKKAYPASAAEAVPAIPVAAANVDLTVDAATQTTTTTQAAAVRELSRSNSTRSVGSDDYVGDVDSDGTGSDAGDEHSLSGTASPRPERVQVVVTPHPSPKGKRPQAAAKGDDDYTSSGDEFQTPIPKNKTVSRTAGSPVHSAPETTRGQLEDEATAQSNNAQAAQQAVRGGGNNLFGEFAGAAAGSNADKTADTTSGALTPRQSAAAAGE